MWNGSGSGDVSGPQFTVPANAKGWNENWTYDCSAFGQSGNFITDVTGYGNAQDTTDGGANTEGMSRSSTNHYYDTGTFSTMSPQSQLD